jgi:hypothetical protein
MSQPGLIVVIRCSRSLSQEDSRRCAEVNSLQTRLDSDRRRDLIWLMWCVHQVALGRKGQPPCPRLPSPGVAGNPEEGNKDTSFHSRSHGDTILRRYWSER